MNLSEAASKFAHVEWNSEHTAFKTQCPNDPTHLLKVALVADNLFPKCWAGCDDAQIRAWFANGNGAAGRSAPAESVSPGSTPPPAAPPAKEKVVRPDPDLWKERVYNSAQEKAQAEPGPESQEEPPEEEQPEPDAAEAPKPSPRSWRLVAYYAAKGILEHDSKHHGPIFASMEPDILFDGIMKDLRALLAEGKLNPLPDLSETELDEELQAAAKGAIRDFLEVYGPHPQEEKPKETPEEPVRVFDVKALYDFIDEWERHPWPMAGVLPPYSLSLMVGKSETGKSTIIYALMRAILLGAMFFGRQCLQGRVLYLAGDPMSEVIAGRLFKAWGITEGIEVVPDALVMYKDGIAQLRRIMLNLKPTLVVADTLGATVNLNTDSYHESYKAQMPLVKLVRELGTHFLGSHHSQKSAMDAYSVIDAALGSVGVAAVASARMATRMYKRAGKQYHTFEMSNLRIGDPIKGEHIVTKYEDGSVDLMGLWKTQNVELDKEVIIQVLTRRGGAMNKRTLWADCRPKPKWDAFNDALDALFTEGRIEIEHGPRGGVLYKLR